MCKNAQAMYCSPRATRRLSESSRVDSAPSSTELTSPFASWRRVAEFAGRSALVTIGHALEDESIGIEEKDGMHHVFFADVRLGFLDDERPELGLARPPVTCWARVK